MNVAHDFFTGGKGAQFTEKANFIRILHDDGTMALYAHLKVESIQYPVGARVARGQFIAESGNTGYSSGPHLHFTVQKNFGMELRSIPFEFADSRGGGFVPEAGMVVRR
jgi:murein DD-endopeptidase MepM/ murein hydrolase activator NlpD